MTLTEIKELKKGDIVYYSPSTYSMHGCDKLTFVSIGYEYIHFRDIHGMGFQVESQERRFLNKDIVMSFLESLVCEEDQDNEL